MRAGRIQFQTTDIPVRQVVLPFVGRDADMATLEAKAHQIFDEEAPEGLLVLGPPGAGKTRLIRELTTRLREVSNIQSVYCAGEPHRRYSSWYVIGSALRDLSGLSEDVSDAHARQVLRALAEEAGVGSDVGDLLAVTLGVPLEARSAALEHAMRDPHVMRDQVYSALGDFFEAKAELRPTLLVLDDAQWADSRSSLSMYFTSCARCGLFVVVTARPHVEDRDELLGSGVLSGIVSAIYPTKPPYDSLMRR